MPTGYGKIDIDPLHPQTFEDHSESRFLFELFFHTVGLSISTGPNEQSIRELLASNLPEDALHVALLNPPSRKNEQGLKHKCVSLVAEVLSLFKSSDIEGTVLKLTSEEGDVLMNYVYKAMELENDSTTSHALLGWHSQLFARFGHGSVLRVFSERLIL